MGVYPRLCCDLDDEQRSREGTRGRTWLAEIEFGA